MKGTLSSTRIRPQTYSTRGEDRPAFPPCVTPCIQLHIQCLRFCCELHTLFLPMPPFGNALPPRTLPKRLARPSLTRELTRECSSASIPQMAKTHKSSSGSSSRSKGTARGQAKLQKKQAFPPPPHAQRGGGRLRHPPLRAPLTDQDARPALCPRP